MMSYIKLLSLHIHPVSDCFKIFIQMDAMKILRFIMIFMWYLIVLKGFLHRFQYKKKIFLD